MSMAGAATTPAWLVYSATVCGSIGPNTEMGTLSNLWCVGSPSLPTHPFVSSTYVSASSWCFAVTMVRISEIERVGSEIKC